MKQKLLRVAILALLLAAVAVLAFIVALNQGMTKAADGFLTAVRANDVAAARGFLAQTFRDSVDEQGLKAHVAKSALSRFKSAHWDRRSLGLNRGSLRGVVLTDAGVAVPLTVSFVKEEGGWRIHSLHQPPAGWQAASVTVVVPSREEQLALVQRAWDAFALAASQKSMRHFHAHLSARWQSQASVEALNEVYAPVVNGTVDLAAVQALLPRLDGDAFLDTDGALVVRGHYPTTPSVLRYEMRFIHEGAWRLSGFYFKLN